MIVSLTDNLLAVQLPDGAREVCIYKGNNFYFIKYRGQEFNSTGQLIKLPPGSYRILFLSKDVTEDECKKVVKYFEGDWFGYRNYINVKDNSEDFTCTTALESFTSLLKSKGLNPDHNYAIISKQ